MILFAIFMFIMAFLLFRHHIFHRKWIGDLYVTAYSHSTHIVAASNATASTAASTGRGQER